MKKKISGLMVVGISMIILGTIMLIFHYNHLDAENHVMYEQYLGLEPVGFTCLGVGDLMIILHTVIDQ